MKKVRLVIKCKTDDVPIAFKVLATKIGEEYEETLERLLELEKKHPVQKKPRGLVTRL